MYGKAIGLLVLVSLVVVAAACGPTPEPQTVVETVVVEKVQTVEVEKEVKVIETVEVEKDPRYGGVLNLGWQANPETLDPMNTTFYQTKRILWHVFETLVTRDANYNIIPMLAERFEISDDGTVYTFYLRKGVLFHNGDEMTAEDVVASLKRWGTLTGPARDVFATLVRLESPEPYVVVIELTKPSAMLLPLLAANANAAVVMPKEIVENIGDKVDEEELIGTGPFRWVEFHPDSYVELERFEDYVARDEPPNGYGGRRTPFVDKLHFQIIPDPTVRAAAVQSGDVDYAYLVPQEQYDILDAAPGVEPFLVKPEGYIISYFNTAKGPMADPRIRRAIYMAVDADEIMTAAVGRSEFYRLDHSLLWKETNWWTDVGAESFNLKDVEGAKELLQEAYGGEEIVILTAREYTVMFRSAQLLKQQLEERLGMNVADLKVVDYATFKQLRLNPDEYDICHMYNGASSPEPGLTTYLFPGDRGFWANDNEQLATLMTEWSNAPTYEGQYAKWVEIQELINEEIPWIKYGDFYGVSALGSNVKGFDTTMFEAFFWNVWLEK